ncbi:DUF1202 family protein [Trabulsiella odontotermitis]|uniref:DUF1202 family protein n=1 Tax=Trabulsiella odontotermitis TaxID=379893 RepID=UPI000675FF97|nr:DUF1202 family protein [Trabulsiella odontotermitis]
MKIQGIVTASLLFFASLAASADTHAPTYPVLSQQFSEQYNGLFHLDAITLEPLDARGNQATYSVKGDMSATEDLYAIVGMAADYQLVEKTWTKGKPVKFSAMMTATGTPESGWTTSFLSMQAAAKNVGHPLEDVNNQDKYLIVNDFGFDARLAKINADFAALKAKQQVSLTRQKELEQEIETLERQINASWGEDKNGKPLSRNDVQTALFQELYQFSRDNDPLKFENNYNATVYEPALAACQKKTDCDATPLRKARDIALSDQQRKYSVQHKIMSNKIKDEMAARDKALQPLWHKQGELNAELVKLSVNSEELQRRLERWDRDISYLRRNGVIH